VLQVIDYLPSKHPKRLNEVKGLVIASYQNELEAAWVASGLEEKFDVSEIRPGSERKTLFRTR